MSESATLRSGSWLLLDTGSAAVIAFAFFVVSARALSPLDFGIAALFVSVSQIILPMIDTLFHDAVIQRDQLDDHDVQTAATASLLWAVLVAIALVLLTPALAAVTNAPELATYLPWLTLSILASGVAAVPAALARRMMRFRSLAIRTVAARVTATAAGLALLYAGAGVWSVVAQAILSVVLASVMLVVMIRPQLRPAIERRRLASMLGFAIPAMGTQLLLFASSRVVTLVISALLGPVSAGVWNVALRFVEPLQIMAATLVGQLMLPIFSRSQTDLVAIRSLYILAGRRASYLLMPMFVGLAVCAPQVIVLFVGERWIAAAAPMSIICITFAIIASRQLVEIVLTALAAPHLNLAVQGGALFLALGGVVAGAQFGLIEGAFGWSLRIVPFVALAAFYLRRRAEIGYLDQILVTAPAVVASAIMAMAVLSIQAAMAEAGDVVKLAISVSVGISAYAVALLAMDSRARQDVRLGAARLSARA